MTEKNIGFFKRLFECNMSNSILKKLKKERKETSKETWFLLLTLTLFMKEKVKAATCLFLSCTSFLNKDKQPKIIKLHRRVAFSDIYIILKGIVSYN